MKAIAATWHDPSSAITCQNVFTVANACDFPAIIKQGESINFTIGATAKNNCASFEAYTPTPAATNIIFVGCKTG